MPPRNKKQQAAPRSGLYRFLALFALLGGVVGVKFLLGTGLRALGVGPQAVPERAAERAAPVETAATAKTPREFVERSLAENRAIVFSKSYCGYSMRGKAVMRKHLGEEGVQVVELDQREDGQAIQDELARITGGRTVPRIFVDGQFIGGADDVTAKDASGELAALLKQKGLVA